jgi:serine protease AprX
VVRAKLVGAMAATLGVALLAVSAAVPGGPSSHAATSSSLGYDPATDAGSLSLITQITGAQAMWNAGYTGAGVDVAVIDTGVTRVPGLDQTGKVVDGPDLSFDSQSTSVAYVDSFGHGTNMASIIAGSDVASSAKKNCSTCLGTSPYTDTTKFVGVAPGARIVNVKVGATNGAVDVSQVIAAIDWVVQHRTSNGLNIRVINLSYGTDATQAASVDPLAYAVETAWKKGIVVVASAGNDGLFTSSMADPAYDPAIIAVGAADTSGTVAIDDDYVPLYAQHGNTSRSVDMVAPGDHVIGLRVPGSYIDTTVTTGKVGTRFQRGSGTSQAAAVASGLAALVLQRFPKATPDQVKAILKAGATPIYSTDSLGKLQPFADDVNAWWEGAGEIGMSTTLTLPANAPTSATGTGTGTIEGARGSVHVASNGVALKGEIDIMSGSWSGARWSAAAWAGTSWQGGIWNGARWSGDTWSGARWSTAAWAGNDWSGARWSTASWSGMTWDGARWSGSGWSGARWSSGSWSGARWSSHSWD